MNLKKYIGVIGIILFIVILLNLDISQLLLTLISANRTLIGLSLIPMVFMLLIQSFKWKNILDTSDIQVSFKDTTIMFLVGYYYGSITPGKIGDFIRSKFLSTHNDISLGYSFSTIFLDRISDLIIIVYLGFIGVIFFIFTYDVIVIPIYILGLLFLTSIIFFYVLFDEKLLSKLVISFFFRFLPDTLKALVGPNFNDFAANLKILTENKKLLLQTLLLSGIDLADNRPRRILFTSVSSCKCFLSVCLICCRNQLIYFTYPDLYQWSRYKRINNYYTILHYSCKSGSGIRVLFDVFLLELFGCCSRRTPVFFLQKKVSYDLISFVPAFM